MNSYSIDSGRSVMSLVVESLPSAWEGISSSCVQDVQQFLFVLLLLLLVLPGRPLFHYFQQLQLIVRLEDQLLNHSSSNFVLNLSNGSCLVNYLHSKFGKFLREELVLVLVWQVLDLLQSQIVELHELHSGERLHIEVSDSSGQLQWSFMVHVLLMVVDSLPNWK